MIVYTGKHKLNVHGADIERAVALCGWMSLDTAENVTPEDQDYIDALDRKGYAECPTSNAEESAAWWRSCKVTP